MSETALLSEIYIFLLMPSSLYPGIGLNTRSIIQ